MPALYPVLPALLRSRRGWERGWQGAGEGSLHRMDQISLKFWLESELEFGHGNTPESSVDD